MPYYMMECYPKQGDASIAEYPDPEDPYSSWITGTRFEGDVPQPLVFEIRHPESRRMRSMFTPIVPLMRDDLVQALRACGVDNLDCYEAVIRETKTGVEHRNYKAVNVIGLVAAVDLDASDTVKIGIGDDRLTTRVVKSLVLDENKAHGQPLFRLAKKRSALVVHDKVATYLREAGSDDMSFIEPADWAG